MGVNRKRHKTMQTGGFFFAVEYVFPSDDRKREKVTKKLKIKSSLAGVYMKNKIKTPPPLSLMVVRCAE